MSSFGDAFGGAVRDILLGVVATIMVNAFVASGLLDESFLFLYYFISGAATLVMILALPRMGYTYLAGSIFAAAILIPSGLIDIVDLLAYLVAPIIIIGWKIYDRFWR